IRSERQKHLQSSNLAYIRSAALNVTICISELILSLCRRAIIKDRNGNWLRYSNRIRYLLK
ncbi:hypothetical protein C0J52_28329, partial [Blattella germanica]